MRATPRSAIPIATTTARGGVSERKTRERTRVERGAVFTMRTEEAIEVNERLAIHVAKWRPKAIPAPRRVALWPRLKAGKVVRRVGRAKGDTTSEASPT